jgi:hypothetical protein
MKQVTDYIFSRMRLIISISRYEFMDHDDRILKRSISGYQHISGKHTRVPEHQESFGLELTLHSTQARREHFVLEEIPHELGMELIATRWNFLHSIRRIPSRTQSSIPVRSTPFHAKHQEQSWFADILIR